ncbi:MAG TPA: hypothetical protein VMT23_02280 [Candidatus Binatia bacterium]|nr:hypothetical protein [Candidatus Binatia bacterium]
MADKKTIVICSSGSFYKHCNEVADELRARGYKVVVPATAEKMKQSGDYDIDKVKTWHNDPKDVPIKISKMRAHFDEIAKGDAILLVNDDKPAQPKYLGPNGLMEWGLAAYLGKPVFILNAVDKSSNYWEEALTAVVLNGDLGKIKL